MWDYLFYSEESGEEFFIECDTEEEAWEIFHANGFSDDDWVIVNKFTPEEAEEIGLDTF